VDCLVGGCKHEQVGWGCARLHEKNVSIVVGRCFAGALLTALLTGCAVFQPANLGDLKDQVTAYHDNGDYQRDLQAVGQAAQDWVRWRAPQVTKPALVLDIDETSLSNWRQLKANDFGYIPHGPCQRLPSGPCGMLAWDQMGKAKAIRADVGAV